MSFEPENVLVVNALWDNEAGVWVATSEDVPGLVAEAENMDKLIERLNCMIPELLELNDGVNLPDEIPFKLLSELNAVAHKQAC